MNIQTIRPPCVHHHDACPCREWEHLKVLNELNALQIRFQALQQEYEDACVKIADSLNKMRTDP